MTTLGARNRHLNMPVRDTGIHVPVPNDAGWFVHPWIAGSSPAMTIFGCGQNSEIGEAHLKACRANSLHLRQSATSADKINKEKLTTETQRTQRKNNMYLVIASDQRSNPSRIHGLLRFARNDVQMIFLYSLCSLCLCG